MDKVFLDITKKCNGKCRYCYTNSGQAKNNELTTSEIKRLIDELAKCGIKSLSIAGGEPLIRSDIIEILYYTKGKIKCSLTSNGTIMNPELISAFIDTNTKITISIDTLDNIHSSLIRTGINLNLVVSNIKLLTQYEELRNIMSLRTTVSTININELLQIVYFCEEYKIPKLKINSLNPYGRAKKQKNLVPDFAQFMEKLLYINNYCLSNKMCTKVELPIEKYLSKQKHKCQLGKSSLLA